MIKDLSSSFLALGNWEEIDMNMQLVRRRVVKSQMGTY